MNKNVLAIDFTIFVNNLYSIGNTIKEFTYDIRDNDTSPTFDISLYKKVLIDPISTLSIKKENIHFLFREENVVDFLSDKDNTTLYHIDFFSDLKDYTYVVNNSSWVRYALDKGLIKDYRWIPNINSINIDNQYCLNFIENINMLDLCSEIDEIFITLSPEYLNIKYHDLFYIVKQYYSTINNYEYTIYENFENRVIVNNDLDNKKVFITYLNSNEEYLGVLALKSCLSYLNSEHELYVVTNFKISSETIGKIKSYKIKTINKEEINFDKTIELPITSFILKNIDYSFEKGEINKEDIKDKGFYFDKINNEEDIFEYTYFILKTLYE